MRGTLLRSRYLVVVDVAVVVVIVLVVKKANSYDYLWTSRKESFIAAVLVFKGFVKKLIDHALCVLCIIKHLFEFI